MADSYTTGQEDLTQDGMQTALSSFLGNQALTTNLAPILDSLFGKYFRSSMTGFNGASAPYAQAGIFGRVDVPNAIFNNAWNSTLRTVTSGAFEAMVDQQDKFREKTQKTLFGASEPLFRSAMPGMSNMLADMVYSRALQIPQLKAGIVEGNRLGGVLPLMGVTGSAGEGQDARNKYVGRVSEAFAGDSYRNYSGMSGQERGQLYAHAMNTGALSGIDTTDDGKLVNEVQTRMQGMARTVQALRGVFQGSVREVLAQLDGLSGADFNATMGASGAGVARRLGSIGMTSGFSYDQVRMMGAGVHSIYEALDGSHSMGAAAATTLTAAVTGASRNMGSPAFINQQRFRENVMRRVVGASESGLARQISGALSLLSEADQKEMNAELANAGELNSTKISEIASRISGNTLSVQDITSAGYTDSAEVIRATGVATQPVLMSNLAKMGEMQKHTVRDVLRDSGLSQEEIDAVSKGPMDSASLEKRLTNAGMDRNKARITAGRIGRRLDMSAKAMGMGNRQELDRMRMLGESRNELNRITGVNDQVSKLQESFGSLGAGGGFMGLVSMIDNGEVKNLGEVMKNLLGLENIEEKKVLESLTGMSENLDDFGQASVMYEMIVKGTYNGKTVSAEQVETARKLMKARVEKGDFTKDETEEVTKLLEEVGAKRDARQLSIIQERRKAEGPAYKLDAAELASINRQQDLEELRDGGSDLAKKALGEEELTKDDAAILDKELADKRLLDSAGKGGVEGLLTAILSIIQSLVNAKTGA